MKQFLVMSIILVCISFFSFSCKDVVVQPPDNIFGLTVDDVSCTEVYLQLKIGAGTASRIVTLKRDTITLFTKTINETETVITDTSLLPGHTYNYQAQLSNGLTTQAQARTLDTTSHNFIWQAFTLGDGTGSNYLNDVAIINDTLAYAVGEIYKDSILYNAAKWNGNTWKLLNISVNFRGSIISPPLEGVFSFSATDIWFVGSLPIHGDGQNWTMYDLRAMPGLESISLSKAWGSSSTSMYFVGRNGSIAHYNGSAWTKMESGTTVNLKDVYGTPDGKEVWTCGWNSATGEGIILRKENSAWETVWHSTQSATSPYNGKLLGSLWTDGSKDFWITGSGDVFRQSITNTNIITREAVSLGNYAYRIRGAGRNDITLAGDGAMIWHFNGKTWYKYGNLFNTDNRLYGLAATSSMTIAVGRAYSTFPTTALIMIGSR